MNISSIFLTSTACYIVQTETNLIAAYLSQNGYQLADSIEAAEAVVITTCAVTQHSADATYGRVLDCVNKRRNGNVPVYVVGCYTRIEQNKMRELSNGNNVFAIPEVRDIEKEFPGKNPFTCVLYNNFFSHPFARQRLANHYNNVSLKFKVRKNSLALFDTLFRAETQFHYLFRNGHLYQPEIQRAIWPVLAAKGCTYKCTYCAVRKGRGKYTSKPSHLILDEIQTGVNRRYKKVLLIGDELGTYGIDLKDGSSLSSLLETFLSDDYPMEVGLWYLDAFRLKEVVPVLLNLAEKNKIFFLGITLQNGSKRILDLMNRRYSIQDTMDFILRIRKYPSIIIATQFMVGFPTETEQDFSETLALVETGCFDNVEVYCYSPRPGTRAAKMTDDVPPEVKEERAERLRELAAKASRRLFLKYVLNELKGNRSFPGQD